MGNLFDLTGKVAVITGSTKGIGKAMAQRMAEHGAKVVISSRKADICDQVASEITAAGGTAMAIPCNISDESQLQNLVDKTIAAWGGIDVLVCNAAANPYYGPMVDVPDGAYDKTMENNIKRNLWLCNMVLPGMAARGGGSVIIVSSIGGLKGSEKLGIYAISKAADMQLVRNLAVEWGDRGITANAISPPPPMPCIVWESQTTSPASRFTWPRRRAAGPRDKPSLSTAAALSPAAIK